MDKVSTVTGDTSSGSLCPLPEKVQSFFSLPQTADFRSDSEDERQSPTATQVAHDDRRHDTMSMSRVRNMFVY